MDKKTFIQTFIASFLGAALVNKVDDITEGIMKVAINEANTAWYRLQETEYATEEK